MKSGIHDVSSEIGHLVQQTNRQVAALARVGCEALELFPPDNGYPIYTHPYSGRPFTRVRRAVQFSPPAGSPMDVAIITDTTGLTIDAIDLSDEAVRVITYRPQRRQHNFVVPFTRTPRKLSLTLAEQRKVFISKVIEIDEAGSAADTYEPDNTDPVALMQPSDDGKPEESADAGYIRAFTERTLVASIIANVLQRTYGVAVDSNTLGETHKHWLAEGRRNQITQQDDPRISAVGRSFWRYQK